MEGCQTTRLPKNLHRLPEIVGVPFRFESTEEIRVLWNYFFRPTYYVGPDDRLILDAGR